MSASSKPDVKPGDRAAVRQMLIEAYANGESQRGAADYLGLPVRTLQRLEQKAGVRRRFEDGTPLG